MYRFRHLTATFVLGLILLPGIVAAKKKNTKKDAEIPASAERIQPAGPATIVSLPGPAESVAVGGGGQFLILNIKSMQKVVVFDVSKGKIAKIIPVPSSNITLAAGAQKLFIGLRDLSQIERWDLNTLTHDGNANAPAGGIETLAMSATAAGPLIALGPQAAKRSWLIGGNNMQVVPFPWKNWEPSGAWGPVHAHISFDGSTAVGCGGGWAGIDLAVLAGDQVLAVDGGGYVNGDTLVSGDGSLIFPDGEGILRTDLTSKMNGPKGKAFPADDSAYCVALDDSGAKPALHLFFTADVRNVFTISGLFELAGKSSLRPEERVHLIPRFQTLVTLGEDNSSLHVRHFDLAEAFDSLGVEYLFADSAPVHWALRGATYKYPIHVRSKRGVVQFTLQSGPRGMKVTPDGVVQWTAGGALAGNDATVIVQIADASGQQIFHTFQVAVVDRNRPRVISVPPPEQHTIIPMRLK
jgi:hypothetical protein